MNNTYYVYSINLYVIIIIDRVDAVTSERFSQQQCSESAVISYDRVFPQNIAIYNISRFPPWITLRASCIQLN